LFLDGVQALEDGFATGLCPGVALGELPLKRKEGAGEGLALVVEAGCEADEELMLMGLHAKKVGKWTHYTSLDIQGYLELSQNAIFEGRNRALWKRLRDI
jgi:hypothetical protein